MGSTPRPHRYALPMATRNTDASTLMQCPGKWFLTNIYETDQAEATYFELGSALHEGIEVTVRDDLDVDQAVSLVVGRIEDWVEDNIFNPNVLCSSTRNMDTIIEDGERMMRSWFKWVHPDSDKRHPIYNDYHWPPQVEVPFHRTGNHTYPVWGSIDAVFTAKTDTEGSFGIADWKSGSSRQREDHQLWFYRYGSQLDVGRAWYHHLDRKQERSVIQEAEPYPGDALVVRRIQATEAIKDRIINEQRVEFKNDWWCNYCPVKEHCPKESTTLSRQDAIVEIRRALKLARPLEDIERVA